MNDDLRPVRLRYTKWGGQPHWQIDTVLLGEDEWGSWLYAPPGTTMSRPGASFDCPVGEAILVSPDRAYTPGFFATWQRPGAMSFEIYADMTTPAVWAGDDEVTMVDLDLDVVRRADGEVEVLDEDEFAEHRIEYGYPEETCRLATATCREVAAAMRSRHEPFGSVGWRWLHRGVRS